MLAISWDVLIAALLGSLLLATIASNMGLRNQLLLRLEDFALLPKWTFFAPIPGTSNFYLLYRDRCADGSMTPWLVLHEMDSKRHRFSFIWNPNRRLRKALHDLITSLPYELYTKNSDLFKLTMPYLIILNHITCLPRVLDSQETQFLIVEKYIDEPAQMLFCSELHRI
jgi:hypothetical protein